MSNNSINPRLAINGFGRIGRLILRLYGDLPPQERSAMPIVAINSPAMSPEDAAYLLKYDSSHGRSTHSIKANTNSLTLNDETITIHGQTIEESFWSKLGVTHVLECSGRYKNAQEASIHLQGGAEKVVVSAPLGSADATIVMGVNQHLLKNTDRLISAGSCTTNCLAPIAQAININFGIESGFMTTVHAYTSDQRILDGRHNDRRRGRAAAMSIIPTSTGAARNIGLVLPELANKIEGVAIRVPTANVSLLDLKVNVRQATSSLELNELMRSLARDKPGIVGITEEEVVSIDCQSLSQSAVVDLTQTVVVNNTLCRLAAWYDNEWGFAARMLDLAHYLVKEVSPHN